MKKSFNIHHSIISIFILSVLLIGCSKKTVLPPQSKTSMDTVCSINAFDDGTEELYAELFSRLDEIESTFSTTIPNSEISRVNEMAGKNPVEVSEDFMVVLTTSLKFSKITDGALDVSSGPLINLWGINTDHARIPSAVEIQEAKKLLGHEKIQINGNKVFLPQAGMSLNFGAVVKGFAADEIATILKKHDVRRAIVDLGGNIYAYGRKADNIPWTIGIKNPQIPEGDPLLKIYIHNKSVVTSGNYERYFEENGKKYHHILDTKTGFPSESGCASVTILCKKSIVADCLSTAAFIMGEEKTVELIPEMEKEFGTLIACIFIDEKNNFSKFGKIKVEKYRK